MSRKPTLTQAVTPDTLNPAILAIQPGKTPEQSGMKIGKRQKPLIDEEDLVELSVDADEASAAEAGSSEFADGGVHLAQAAGTASDAPPLAAGSMPASAASSSAAGTTAMAGISTGVMIAGGVVLLAAAAGSNSDDGSEAAPTEVSGSVIGGPVVADHGLTVNLYQANGTTLLGTDLLDPTGKFTIDVGTYTGVVIAKVVNANGDPDYRDEATGQAVDLAAELMAVGVASGGKVTLNINPLTTVAALQAGAKYDGDPTGTIDTTEVTEANSAVAQAFGLTDLTGSEVVTTVNDSGTANGEYDPTTLSNAELYGAVLAALSGVDQNGGAQATIDALAANLTVDGANGTLNTTALNALMAGAAVADGNTTGNLISTISDALAQTSASVSINPIATDNAINNAEKTAGVTLTGSNVAGATVELSIGVNDREATVTGTTWSYTLVAADYTAMGEGGETITATSTLTTGTGAAASTTTATATRSIAIDSVVPTLAISSNDASLTSGETATLSFTFSEAPNGFAAADITTTGGTLSGLSSTAVANVYTATFTPTPNTAAGNASITVAAGAYTDAAGNTGGAGTTPAISIDTLVPTLAITSNDAALKIGETATITFTFSETPTGFAAGDITTTGGTLSGLEVTGDNKVYTATFTPTAGFEGNASITVAAGAYTDAAGNTGGAGTTPAIAIDILAPTLAITSNDADLKIGETATITFDFSEAPSGFVPGDVVTTGGSLSNPTVTADPTIYTATFTPTVGFEGSASISVASGIYTDAAGNNGGAGVTPTISIDTLAPTATAAITGADDNVPATSTINIAASSTTNDNTPTLKGTITGSLGTSEVVAVYDGATRLGAANVEGSNWSLTTASLGNGAHSFSVRVEDTVGNQSAASTAYAFNIDATVPTATAPVTGLADDVALNTGNIVSGGVSNDPVPMLSGTITGTLAAGDVVRVFDGATLLGNATVSGATWSFTTSTLLPGAHSFTALVENVGGNQGVAGSPYNVTLDFSAPAAPTLALTTDTGSSASDKITSNGALTTTGVESGATVEFSTNGGTTWSSTFTPVAGSNSVQARQTDAAGNISTASSAFVFTFDNTAAAPTLALTTDTGSSTSDKITSNGALTATGVESGATLEYSTNGGTTWSSTFTPVAGSNSVQARQTDVAGNISTASVAFTFTFDGTAPSAPTLALTTDTGSSGSDKITNNGALTATGVESGATVEFSTNGGTTWSSTVTPVAGSNSVQARQTDVAGNMSTGSDTFSFTFDNTPPSFTSGASASFPNLGTGTAYTAAANDAGTVSYSLTGTDAALFNINANTGVVTFKAPPSTAAASDAGADNVYNINAVATDLSGNSSSQAVAITVVNAPTLQTSALDDVTNFEVTSNIVLTYSGSVAAVAGKSIHIVNVGGTGFHGESAVHTQDILVTDTTQVSIVDGKVTINPTFDLDLSNTYHIKIDAGAFTGTVSQLATVEFDGTSSLNFATVAPGAASLANAVQSQAMDATGALVDGHKWLDMENIGSATVVSNQDLSTGSFALVGKDYDTIGTADADAGYDGMVVGPFNILALNFGANDLIYIDDQANSASSINDFVQTALFIDIRQGDELTILSFAGSSTSGATTSDTSGGLMALALEGSSLGYDSISAIQAALLLSTPPIISA